MSEKAVVMCLVDKELMDDMESWESGARDSLIHDNLQRELEEMGTIAGPMVISRTDDCACTNNAGPDDTSNFRGEGELHTHFRASALVERKIDAEVSRRCICETEGVTACNAAWKRRGK